MNFDSKFPNGLRIAIAMGTLLSVLIAFNQCTPQKNSNGKKMRPSASAPITSTGDAGDIDNGNELPEGLEMPPMNAQTPDSDLDEMDFGIKNHEQILLSMAALTGVSPRDSAVLKEYRELAVQLPADNNMKSFLPSNQVAIIKMAAVFCDRLVQTQNLYTIIWPDINLALPPTQVFTKVNKKFIINQSIKIFLPPMEPGLQEKTENELDLLFDELLTGEDPKSNMTTKKVVTGMCVSTLASAHSIFL